MKKQFKISVKNRVLPAAFVLAVFCAWTNRKTHDIQKAEWLLGTWENKTSRGSVYETWDKVSSVELAGRSFSIKGKDTLVFETIRLVQEKDRLFYIPTVRNQNEGLPVRFASVKVSDAALIFENPEHDFPQVISYAGIGADSLMAEISGFRNGQERRQVFPMKRIK